ncbi:hypothetical protein EON65_37655 [archaeon]|nr:MAG: hypothetical protein EON65_37655 [archaeon]
MRSVAPTPHTCMQVGKQGDRGEHACRGRSDACSRTSRACNRIALLEVLLCMMPKSASRRCAVVAEKAGSGLMRWGISIFCTCLFITSMTLWDPAAILAKSYLRRFAKALMCSLFPKQRGIPRSLFVVCHPSNIRRHHGVQQHLIVSSSGLSFLSPCTVLAQGTFTNLSLVKVVVRRLVVHRLLVHWNEVHVLQQPVELTS